MALIEPVVDGEDVGLVGPVWVDVPLLLCACGSLL